MSTKSNVLFNACLASVIGPVALITILCGDWMGYLWLGMFLFFNYFFVMFLAKYVVEQRP